MPDTAAVCPSCSTPLPGDASFCPGCGGAISVEASGAPSEAHSDSGIIYRTVTRHWPRIAVGLVVVAALAEWVVGGLTADTALESYVFAWGATTGGLWFMFEKAEKALSREARERVGGLLVEMDLKTGVDSIPGQFSVLFDRVFGDKHWSRKCFYRSAIASVVGAVCITALLIGTDSGIWAEIWHDPRLQEDLGRSMGHVATFGIIAVFLGIVLNIVPDYVSLLETRWAIGLVRRGAARLGIMLVLDLIVTGLISYAFIFLIMEVLRGPPISPLHLPDLLLGGSPWTPAFFTAFLTSMWLWLYAASVLLARALVRMGGGVGFLLRVTDVERQPFRSMGFVSVLIVSGIFLVGLPSVLL